jgi:hypothetical protein
VTVDNLITLGTPHGGEWGELPLSSLIGLMTLADLDYNLSAVKEIAPPVLLWQNLTNSQPEGVDYYLVSGDARGQFTKLWAPILSYMYYKWPITIRLLQPTWLYIAPVGLNYRRH